MLGRLRGQSTLEYAMIIAVVVGALLAMQIYMRRGIQGKLRESTDDIGGQYSAGNVTSKFTTSQLRPIITSEQVGIADQGVSRYEITQEAETDTYALGANAEKVTKKLSDEKLLPNTP